MASVPKPRMTLKEYLELEEHSEECHEFHDGEVFAVAGGTRRHSEMITGIGSELRRQIRAAKADCPVYIQMRLFIAAYSRAVYPDVTVTCGREELLPAGPDGETLLNPVAIIEVLS
jgi:Uma2 family endonuclease